MKKSRTSLTSYHHLPPLQSDQSQLRLNGFLCQLRALKLHLASSFGLAGVTIQKPRGNQRGTAPGTAAVFSLVRHKAIEFNDAYSQMTANVL